MIRLIKFIFSGCFHVWDDVDQQIAQKNGFGGMDLRQPMKCQRCGEQKSVRI